MKVAKLHFKMFKSNLYSDIVDCPENFTYVPSVNGCYYLVTEELTWHLANLRCISLHPNSHLVVIDNAAEQTAVTDMLYRDYPCEYVKL